MSPALWYLTRATGAVTLALLTVSVVLGILELRRLGPRFGVAAVHRSVSLLVVVLLAVHVGTAVLDSFAPIRLVDAFVPLAGTYRPLWLGLGALALDLLVALVVTSLLRGRLGLRTWRAVHWAAYACWPVAVLHGLGTGSDAKAAWMQALTATCALAVVAAVAVRRPAAGLAAAAVAVAVVAWLPGGPLGHGWARRAGTPARLLRTAPAAVRTPVSTPVAGPVSGVVHEGRSAGGAAVADLHLRAASGPIRVRLGGEALAGGGVGLRESSVTVTSGATHYRGRVSKLAGPHIEADVAARDGRALHLVLDLRVDGDVLAGTATTSPLGSAR